MVTLFAPLPSSFGMNTEQGEVAVWNVLFAMRGHMVEGAVDNFPIENLDELAYYARRGIKDIEWRHPEINDAAVHDVICDIIYDAAKLRFGATDEWDFDYYVD